MSFTCMSAICCLGSPSQGWWRRDIKVPSGLQSSETDVAGFCSAVRAGQTYGPSSTAAPLAMLDCWWPAHIDLPCQPSSSYIMWSFASSSNLIPNDCTKNGTADTTAKNMIYSSADISFNVPPTCRGHWSAPRYLLSFALKRAWHDGRQFYTYFALVFRWDVLSL